MTLKDLQSGGSVALALIGADRELAMDVQARLVRHGILDPPVDAAFGPVSLWAITQFLRRLGTPGKVMIDREVADALLDDAPLFPLHTPDSLAGRIVRAMTGHGYWLNRHPDCINLVYVEGMDADGG